MAWNNVYLSNTPGATYGSAATIPLTTSGVSVQANLAVGSTVSIRGTTTLHGALNSASAFSSGALSGTSATFSDRVAIGAGKPIVFVSASSTSLAAITAAATKSTTTTFTNNSAAIGDIITWGLGNSTSSLSAGLTMDMYVSAASTIEIRLSNVSTAAASQPAISVTYMLERLVW